MYIYIYIYIYICVCVYIYIYISMYIHITCREAPRAESEFAFPRRVALSRISFPYFFCPFFPVGQLWPYWAKDTEDWSPSAAQGYREDSEACLIVGGAAKCFLARLLQESSGLHL